jgi:uncharacterized protein (TIGR03663 family)
MKRALIVIGWLVVLAVALVPRTANLGERPVHADEATGARITARLMESGDYRFDPHHYHGPTLGALGALTARAAGASGWRDLEITPLRVVPVVAGVLVVMLPLLGRRRYGDVPMLAAAMLLACSPLLVYFSRMYIHEMLLALFGGLALWQATGTRARWLAGLWVGLMYATKETFAISMIAWAAAAAAVYLMEKRGRPDLQAVWAACWRDVLAGGALAMVVALVAYTGGFRNWQGAVDAVRTYFIYETVAGHDKPFGWYAQLMVWPELRGGHRWGEPLVALLGMAAVLVALRPGALPRASRLAVMFLGISALAHLLVYSVISYKTPWLMVLPWAHVAVLGGFAFCHPWLERRRVFAVAAALVLAVTVAAQFSQVARSSFRYASDSRNPLAYPATSSDITTMEAWISALDEAAPWQSIEPIGVIGADYWPLPWYLRHHQHVGYWAEPPENLARLPLVFDLAGIDAILGDTHVPIPRGLRDGLPVTAWVREDFWDAFITAEPPSP